MSIIDDALARSEARPVKKIDYERMNRIGRSQKAALTRAVNSGDAEKIAEVCKKAVQEWNEIGCWRDDWNYWQSALNDALPWHQHVDIADL